MTKDYRLANNLKTKHTRDSRKNKLVHNFVECVDLRIDDVSTNEIKELSTLIYALKSSQYKDNVVKVEDGTQDFVVKVKPARLTEIKQALHAILRIVKGDRIEIDT